MAMKFAAVSALTLLAATSFNAAASDEPTTVHGIREQLVAGMGPGYAHVAKIVGPVRSVSAAQLGVQHLLKPDAAIAVVGPLADAAVRQILGLVGTGVSDATKVAGDQEFAVVQLGDPQRDPCCTTTVLFENRKGSWTSLGAITRSH